MDYVFIGSNYIGNRYQADTASSMRAAPLIVKGEDADLIAFAKGARTNIDDRKAYAERLDASRK